MCNRAKSLLECVLVKDRENAVAETNCAHKSLSVFGLLKTAQYFINDALQACLKELRGEWLHFLENHELSVHAVNYLAFVALLTGIAQAALYILPNCLSQGLKA
jgi:hypothetical protein